MGEELENSGQWQNELSQGRNHQYGQPGAQIRTNLLEKASMRQV